jgi:hypothetical protein
MSGPVQFQSSIIRGAPCKGYIRSGRCIVAVQYKYNKIVNKHSPIDRSLLIPSVSLEMLHHIR